ncbi:MAG: CoA transferase, partial [Chloroflexota bacterium]
GDRARRAGPFPGDIPDGEASGLFLYLNTNKLGVTLNPETALGHRLFEKLVEKADILVESNSPGTMESLGLGYSALVAVNPRLIVVSITPFGQTGPYSEYRSCDLINQHMGGLGASTPGIVENPEKEFPLKVGGYQADMLTGVTAALLAMSAVAQRTTTGRGCHIDLSEHEAMAAALIHPIVQYLSDGIPPIRAKATSGSGGRYGAGGMLPCKNGSVQLHCGEDHQWRAFAEVTGKPEWACGESFKTRALRARNWESIEPELLKWASERTVGEVYTACQAKHVPCLPVNTIGQVVQNEHLEERKFFVDIEHPKAGRLRYPGAPYKFSRTPCRADRPAPLLSQHNEEVICGMLGHSQSDLIKMREAGAI